MVEKLDIAKSIYAFAKPSSDRKMLRALQIADYFQEISPAVQEKWPFDFSDLGFQTEYLAANRETVQAGAISNINIKSIIKKSDESYVFNSTWQIYDGQISLSLDELHRKGSGAHTKNFAGHLLHKMQSFLVAHDKAYQEDLPSYAKKIFEPSIITLSATSNNSKTANRGGLIWASLGFDFANREELLQTQSAFKLYANKKQGVEIATKDMELFTKPCHFVAFDCGRTVKDKNERSTSLGKAFLVLHSWDGVWKNENPRAEEKRYADVYFNDAANPTEQLNSSYRKMLKRYQNKYGTLQKKSKLAVYKSQFIYTLRSFTK